MLYPLDNNQALIAGINVSLLAFLVILFIEEVCWSSKHVDLY